MKIALPQKLILCCLLLAVTLPVCPVSADPGNPNIDMRGYLRVAKEAADHRRSRRVSEDEFIRMSLEPKTVVLDARSREKFDLLHVQGAVNLSFPDIDIASLKKALPDQNTRILIYCNNNFVGNEKAFPGKQFSASLNLSTYIALYNYGYKNVYELAPLINVNATRLPLVPSPPLTAAR